MASDPRFSLENITSILANPDVKPSTLVDELASLEGAANTPPPPDSLEIFSTYYAAFTIALLLDDDV